MDDQRDYAEEAAIAQHVRDEMESEFFDNREEIRGKDDDGQIWRFYRSGGIYPLYHLLRVGTKAPFMAISDFWTLHDLSRHYNISWE